VETGSVCGSNHQCVGGECLNSTGLLLNSGRFYRETECGVCMDKTTGARVAIGYKKACAALPECISKAIQMSNARLPNNEIFNLLERTDSLHDEAEPAFGSVALSGSNTRAEFAFTFSTSAASERVRLLLQLHGADRTEGEVDFLSGKEAEASGLFDMAADDKYSSYWDMTSQSYYVAMDVDVSPEPTKLSIDFFDSRRFDPVVGNEFYISKLECVRCSGPIVKSVLTLKLEDRLSCDRPTICFQLPP